jgi:hypothetical protein
MKLATLRWVNPTTTVLVAIAATLLLLALTSCETMPKVPKTVTVVVEKFKPLPKWATEQLPKPMPADGKVSSHLSDEDARGAVIDYANCRSKLIEAMDAGGSVDAKECQR